jgi:hypothetical protein
LRDTVAVEMGRLVERVGPHEGGGLAAAAAIEDSSWSGSQALVEMRVMMR